MGTMTTEELHAESTEKRFSVRKSLMRRASMFLPRRSRAESIVSMHSSRGSLTEVKKPKMNEIKELMERILHASCDDLSYTTDCEDSNFCTVLNDELHKRVKQLIPNRYRFTIQVIIAE